MHKVDRDFCSFFRGGAPFNPVTNAEVIQRYEWLVPKNWKTPTLLWFACETLCLSAISVGKVLLVPPLLKQGCFCQECLI